MRGRAALALALIATVGCGGGSASRDAGDAGRPADATPDSRDAPGADLLTDAQREASTADAGGDGAGDAMSDGDATGREAASDRAEVSPEVAWPNLCGTSRGMLTTSSAPATGILGAVSANPVVSCGGGLSTSGADAAYTLVVETPGLIELVIDSGFDAVLALRSGCETGVSEIACNSSALRREVPAIPSDAGSEADGGAQAAGFPWRTTLHTRVAAGSYTVIVDARGPRDASSPFVLSARPVEAAPNATCATPLLISAGMTVTAQDLDLGGEPSGACGSRPGSTLTYSVGVPSGQRLTVRATPLAGDRTWQPRLEASATCGAGACLAQGHTAAGATQVLDWLNNGPNWRLVMLAVSADGPVNGARFNLAVGVANQLATCNRPTVVTDGTMLLGQDISHAPVSDLPTCGGDRVRALYYAATLLPRQELTATALSSSGAAVVTLAVRPTCEASACQDGSSSVGFKNDSEEPQTILIEARPAFFTTLSGNFDLLISMPPPPAGVLVAAPFGLTTTEAGGTAKATIVLRAPPTAKVSITLASDTPSEGTVAPALLEFDATNWSVPRDVTVTGVDDHAADGARRYMVVTSKTSSADPRYAAVDVDDFEVTNLDDDPGTSFDDAEHLVTSEGGGTATFKVRLNRQPAAPVHVPLSSSDVSEGAVSPAELVFSATDWNVGHEVTITGVDDAIRDGTQTYSIIVGALVSADPAYAGQNPPDVSALNRDDDQAAVSLQVLSGDRSCELPLGRSITTDLAGTIYIAMVCDGNLVVLSSADGGATFTQPVIVKPSASLNEVAIAGGPSGVVHLAYQSFDNGLVLKRSTDGGATWSEGLSLLGLTGSLRLAAAGDTVLVTSNATDGGESSLLWRSLNGGRSVSTRTLIDRPNVELFLRPDGRTVFLLEPGDPPRIRKSTNGGETFAVVGAFSPNGWGLWGITSGAAIGANGNQLTQYPLAALNDWTNHDDFISEPLAMTIDDRDMATIIDVDPLRNRMRASRFDFAANVSVDPKPIGPRPNAAGVVALSPRAVATVFSSGSVVLFAVTTWP